MRSPWDSQLGSRIAQRALSFVQPESDGRCCVLFIILFLRQIQWDSPSASCSWQGYATEGEKVERMEGGGGGI